MTRSHLVLLTFSVLASACSASTSGDSPAAGESMGLAAGCLRSRCDERLHSANSACSACVGACAGASYDCDIDSACRSSCAPPRACDDRDRSECVAPGFIATLPTNVSAELGSACKDMARTAARCGWRGSPTERDCDHFAIVERPERAALYRCSAALACDADQTECAPAATDFGTKLCGAVDAACGASAPVCFRGAAEGLDLEGAWLRPDVMAAAELCTKQPSCNDTRACFSAWMKAVLP